MMRRRQSDVVDTETVSLGASSDTTSIMLSSKGTIKQSDASSKQQGVVVVSKKSLVLAALPLVAIAIACWCMDFMTMSSSILVGCVRTFIQLSILGSVLRPIFVLGRKHAVLVVLYALFMLVLAANEASSRSKYTFHGQFVCVLASLLITVSLVAVFAFAVVLKLKPLHDPRYVIPITGMLLGNSINGVSLSLNALTKSLVEQAAEIELYLSFGATKYEACYRVTSEAIRTGSTPVLNMLRVTGIISIPGMMTGHLLGGSDTVEAARYQILILYLISVCTIGVILMQSVSVVEVGFDSYQMLRPERFLMSSSSTTRASMLTLTTWLLASAGITNQVGIPPSSSSQSISDEDIMVGSGSITIRSLQGDMLSQETTKPLLELQGIGRSIEQRVLFDNITATVHAGELVLISGPSGTGKSQLMRVIAGLTPADNTNDGSLKLDGKSFHHHHHDDGEMIYGPSFHWRRQVRYVPQSKIQIPGSPLDFVQRVANFKSWKQQRHVCFKKMTRSVFCPPTVQEMIDTTRKLLIKWGLQEDSDTILEKEWTQLSGGEAQRVILALSIASKPRVLLLDESTSALDLTTKQAVEQTVLQQLQQQPDLLPAILWISHDEQQAERMSHGLNGKKSLSG